MEREESEMEANMRGEKKKEEINSHSDDTLRPFKLDMYLFV